MIRRDPVEVLDLFLMLCVSGERIDKSKYGNAIFYLQKTPEPVSNS
jgi:hypothetical protein